VSMNSKHLKIVASAESFHIYIMQKAIVHHNFCSLLENWHLSTPLTIAVACETSKSVR